MAAQEAIASAATNTMYNSDPVNALGLTLSPPVDDSIQRSLTASPSQVSPQGSNNGSKRPPRKSTLTQQQKNQKRQRATQDQLTTLENEFNKNPTPTATVRERIADEINMTERSVQIWFQNRRAKIKLLTKKSIETGEHFECLPEPMRAYIAMQAMENGKSIGGMYMGRGLMPYHHGNMPLGVDPAAQGKVLIQYLTCRSLNIGKWMRVGQNAMDLIVFYSPEKCTMTYYINNEQSGYKIEYPFAYIKNIFLDNNEADPSKGGGIVIELNKPPHFYMDQPAGTDGFQQVGDFTEDQQATTCMVHHLGGNPKVLSGQLAKLVSLDSFMNRHHMMPFETMHSMPMSTPASPIHRPASQPNFAQPQVSLFQENSWAIGAVPPGMRHGHRRQRSRSVPAAVDFSLLQTPMPSFYIQHPGESQAHPHDPTIYAPIPQQPNTSLNNNHLRIDTQAGFGLDMRQYPASATTAASAPDFPSPNFYPPVTDNQHMAPNSFNTPYNGQFLSPMMTPASHMIPQSVSPLSFSSHGDPAILEQSPPLSMLGRSQSADLYTMHESAISDDGHSLNEMYSKHTINLPMHPHSPSFMDNVQADLDMNQLVSFDPVDAASLSPESIAHGMPIHEHV